MPHDVFISHSARDKSVADAACAALEGRKIRCWIAPRDVMPGRSWGGAIVDAINGSRVMVVIFSSHSNGSRQVIREVEQAVKRSVAILPLRIEDVPLSADMDYFISTLHWLDALSPPLERHLAHLAETIGVILSQSNAPADPPLTVSPREPEATVDDVVSFKLDADLAWERITDMDRAQQCGFLLDQAQRELRLASEYDRRQAYVQAIDSYKKFILSAGRIERHGQLRQETQTARRTAQDRMTAADKSFMHAARPASYARGTQALTDADRLYEDGVFGEALLQLAAAVERFGEAAAAAQAFNALGDAQQAWIRALAAADTALLGMFATAPFLAATSAADDARAAESSGQIEWATTRFHQAVATLAEAAATATREQRSARFEAVVPELQSAIADRNREAADDLLAGLEHIDSGEHRIAALRSTVAALLPRLTIDLGGVRMEFVPIPAGSFSMGSELGEANERPVHQVTIAKPFYLGKYQVTQDQWLALMGHNRSGSQGPRNPVDRISWDECQIFLRRLAVRVPRLRVGLPTEAQWEYACRAGGPSDYCYGHDPARLGEFGWYALNAGSKSHPVGERTPNAWHLHDMHGNVWEWCADVFDAHYYASDPCQDPTGPDSGSLRVLRGGSYSHPANTLRSAHRYWAGPSVGIPCYGFRVCVMRAP